MKKFTVTYLCMALWLFALSSCGLNESGYVDDINSETLMINSDLSSGITADGEQEEISEVENKRIVLEWSSGEVYEVSVDPVNDTEITDSIDNSEEFEEVETGFLYRVEGVSTISRNIIICDSVYGEAVTNDEVHLLGLGKDMKGTIARVSSVISVKLEYDRYLTGLEVPEIAPSDIKEGQIITNMDDFEQATIIAVEMTALETISLDEFAKFENLITEAWGTDVGSKLSSKFGVIEQGATAIILLEFEHDVAISPQNTLVFYDDQIKVGKGTVISVLK